MFTAYKVLLTHYLILTITPRGRKYNYPYLTDVEGEAERVYVTCPVVPFKDSTARAATEAFQLQIQCSVPEIHVFH